MKNNSILIGTIVGVTIGTAIGIAAGISIGIAALGLLGVDMNSQLVYFGSALLWLWAGE